LHINLHFFNNKLDLFEATHFIIHWIITYVNATLCLLFVQIGFSPAFTVVIISTIGLLQGMDVEHIKTKLKNELLDVIVTGWKVNFGFLLKIFRDFAPVCNVHEP